MRIKVIFSIIALLLCMASSYAQTFLNSADGKSGVVSRMNQDDVLNYSVTDSRLGFSLKKSFDTINGKDPVVKDFKFWDIDFGISLKDKKKDIFKGGDFAPGSDITISRFRNYERDPTKHTGFWGVTLPIIVYQTQKVMAAFKPDATDSIALLDKAQHKLGIGAALNSTIGSENFIIGISGFGFREWRSTGDAKIREVSVTEVSGTNAGNQTTIYNSEDRYSGKLHDEFKAQIRLDAFYNVLEFSGVKNPGKNATLGILLGSSIVFSEFSNPLYNISIGPTLQPAGYPNQIAFALLFETFDYNNDVKTEDFIEDNFRVRVYIGVPFKVFK